MSQLYHIYWLIPICWRGISLIIPPNHRVPWATWNTPLCWVITKAHSASKEYLYLLATSNYFAFYHWTCRESKYNACTVWGFAITCAPNYLTRNHWESDELGGTGKEKFVSSHYLLNINGECLVRSCLTGWCKKGIVHDYRYSIDPVYTTLPEHSAFNSLIKMSTCSWRWDQPSILIYIQH